MKNIRTIAAAVLMLGFAAGSVYGQWGTPALKVTVPFQFSIGEMTLDSGDYLISSASNKVWIQEASGRYVAVLVTNTLSGNLNEPNSKLVFHCYSGECFLSQVWFGGQDTGHTLLSGKHQEELASRGAGQQFTLPVAKPLS